MKNTKPFIFLLLLLLTQNASAELWYISDMQYIPLRSGPGNEYRIIHKGLPSGTAMSILETDKPSGYSKIRTVRGTEGWIRTQYLINQPTARSELEMVQARLEKTTTASSENANRLEEALAELETLSAEKSRLEKQLGETSGSLAELKKVSANTVEINEKNRVLLQKNHLLENELDVLKAENQRLQDSSDRKMFIQGGALTLIAILLGAWLSGIKRRRSYSSGW